MKLAEQLNGNLSKLFPLELYDGTKVRILGVYSNGMQALDLESISGHVFYGVPKQDIKWNN